MHIDIYRETFYLVHNLLCVYQFAFHGFAAYLVSRFVARLAARLVLSLTFCIKTACAAFHSIEA